MIDGSALRKLEAVTGLKTEKMESGGYRLEVAPGVAFFSFKKDEKEACKELREQNWRRVVRLACEAAGWKCVRCRGIKPLQGHHKIYRSRWTRSDGPLDVVSNVDALCDGCHGKEHRG